MCRDKPVVFLCGPTASGKTSLAIALAERYPVRIISVDSALIYCDMNIGTAKPSAEERARAPHHLIDIVQPQEAYSVAQFRKDALREIETAHKQGQIPLLVGGSMMYFNALEKGLSRLPASDPLIRSALQQRLQQQGAAELHAELQQIDPQAAERIHPNDPQRILRALEVYQQSGQSLSQLQQQQSASALPYPILKLARSPRERAVLHERIARRFDNMLAQGFEQEVLDLLKYHHLHANMPSMRSVGYRQMLQYISGEMDYAEMRERGIIATRQLAKRQYTWLRAMQNLNWLYDDEADLLKSASRFIDASLC
ncbi:MAG: tRNA (adenosine(37)-N6)-dimethylallyltransferase MiaA [gamma proteobacterium symbiont of Bathyaustriella thionipta]|nr:tRNA (adenosine(37)-N6)-dimethylallyltransferase MiaA [gamma proteobacterium symbiont of Bathyaustriella thionipta]